MRSNDLFLGTPHNFVQFTSLQEVVAGWLGVAVGSFALVVDSLHVYEHDIQRLSLRDEIPTARNTDSLILPKPESERITSALENTMDRFVQSGEDLAKSQFLDLIDRFDAPPAWRNILYIVAADTARRRNWLDEMKLLRGKCTNPALNLAWDGWLERTRQS
jgi:thymidylate synthase